MVNGKSNGSITEGWEQQVEGEGMIILICLTNNENLWRRVPFKIVLISVDIKVYKKLLPQKYCTSLYRSIQKLRLFKVVSQQLKP